MILGFFISAIMLQEGPNIRLKIGDLFLTAPTSRSKIALQCNYFIATFIASGMFMLYVESCHVFVYEF